MNFEFQIRPAVEADCPAIFPLASSLATSFSVEEGSFCKAFHSILSNPTMCLAVAGSSGSVAGYVLGTFHPCFYANGNAAWVEELMVDPRLRNCGLGRALMEYFESWARMSDCLVVALATRRAREFYTAIGYTASAEYFRKDLALA